MTAGPVDWDGTDPTGTYTYTHIHMGTVITMTHPVHRTVWLMTADYARNLGNALLDRVDGPTIHPWSPPEPCTDPTCPCED